ncbi:MAG: FMN-binding protein [Sphaerochaeta sp.]|uniref:FMN-binding protein n=1 Tax=Sphaerochaeta sp. TaxID=1972642 RepID=UPI002FC8FF96
MSRTATVLLIILALLVMLVALAVLAFKHIQRNLDHLKDLSYAPIVTASLRNGTYEGTYQTFPVKAKVSLAIKDGSIANLVLLEHRNGQGSAAETIIGSVLKAQNLDVDAISGATYSSKVILKAIEDALHKAGNP